MLEMPSQRQCYRVYVMGYEKKHRWEVTHEIDVANCDIEYWTGSPTLVNTIIGKKYRNY